ncbi:MAG: proline dehydrogenase, partial [Bacteroidia bacterium]
MNSATNAPMSTPDFNNTEIAFKYKSNEELRISYLLFQALGMNWLVTLGPKVVKFCFDSGIPIKGMIKKTVFRQFCGGESMNECLPKMQQLHSYK